MIDTSQSLLERLRKSEDRAAWDRFVELYVPVLQHWADQLLTDQAEADDLVQEAFLILFEKLPQFEYRKGGSFRGWLKTVLRNVFLQRVRKSTRETAHLTQLLHPTESDDPAELILQSELNSILYHRALQIINHDFDEVTVQAALAMILEARPALEIANETGLTRAAVYAAKARVLSRLRQELGEMLD